MTHQDALNQLREIIVLNEGCPIPKNACQCESTEGCVLGALLETATFPNPVNRP